MFFVSTIYFVQGFDLHDHPERISIDLSQAHIWDQSGVAALDQVIRKLRLGGSEVSVVGMNQESLDLFERIGGQESAHAKGFKAVFSSMLKHLLRSRFIATKR